MVSISADEKCFERSVAFAPERDGQFVKRLAMRRAKSEGSPRATNAATNEFAFIQSPLPNSIRVNEAEVGVEPTHRGFADLGLPTWLLRRFFM